MDFDQLRELRGLDVLSLGMRADEVRRAKPNGGVVTYLRVHTLTAPELRDAIHVPREAAEVRLYETPTTMDEALRHVRSLREAAGARRVVAYSLADLEERARGGWGSLTRVLRQLVSAGLSDLAEIPVDRVSDLWKSMDAVIDAGIAPKRLTVSHPAGDRKEEMLDDVGDWRWQMYAVPLRFSPLPRIAPADKPTTGYEDVRMVALSRLAFDDEHRFGQVSIEVDWSLYGPKLAQVALTFGADHLDAVPATSDASRGPRRATVAGVERNIRAAGFEPKEYLPE